MSRGKFEQKGRNNRIKIDSKFLALVLACILLVGGVVSGTVAWLTAKTGEVKNVFTTSDIIITLQEHEYDANKDELNATVTITGVENYKMVPGWTIPKDPWLTVKGSSEDCWVFIKVEEKGGNITVAGEEYSFDDFIAYAIDGANWTQLIDKEGEEVAGVYYCYANDIDEERNIKILGPGKYTFNGADYIWSNNEVLTKPEVTKVMMDEVTDGNKPTLTFTAYASQYWKNNTTAFTAAEAWNNISGK